MIDLDDLEFAYGESGFGLRVDRLVVDDGERVAWTGPSGSGKTTLLQLVAGIVQPRSGSVVTGGSDLTKCGEAARRNFRIVNIGLVFQEFELLDYLSVIDNILLAYRINNSLRMTAAVRARANKLATEIGLGELIDRRPGQLSHGERQRVAVCRALLPQPKLVLADEPTANLDPYNARHVLDMLEAYVADQQATLVTVTHDHDLLDRFDRVIDVSRYRKEKTVCDVGGRGDEL